MQRVKLINRAYEKQQKDSLALQPATDYTKNTGVPYINNRTNNRDNFLHFYNFLN